LAVVEPSLVLVKSLRYLKEMDERLE
jgi:hypothetical protein